MAETTTMNVNGNYMPHQPETYGAPDPTFGVHNPNSSVSTTADYNGASQGGVGAAGGGESGAAIPKPEVGWYFVEQYYTTMSRNPEKLFLFYNRRSQFVTGNEAETVSVCVGQKAINDRIKELDIQDCKVRVTNVDSQGSGQNIVIQVIGEISMKSAPQRKFTQTFVLAEQTNGYFVLNDIFRYIAEDDEEPADEEEAQHPQIAAESGYQEPADAADDVAAEPSTLTSSNIPVEQERDVAIVDQGLEAAMTEEPSIAEAADPELNGEDATEVEVAEEEEAPVAAITATDAPAATPDEILENVDKEDVIHSEQPQDPEPTPAASPPKSAVQPAAPAAPAKPTAPKTWANLVAGNRAATASPAAPASAPTGPSTAPKAPLSVPTQPAAAAAASITSASTPEPEQTTTPQSSGSEWQTAGPDHSRKQSRPQATQSPADNSRAYIKNVGENIDSVSLRSVLSKIAEVIYLDINRQKNCAFVDFSTAAGYQAAVAANPHEVNGDRIYVEERRIRPQVPGYNNTRGGAGRGRGGPDNRGRGSFTKDNNTRGGFSSRGRGTVNSRGRGVSQAA